MASWMLLGVLGTVLVHASAIPGPEQDIPDADIYTDYVHFRYTPRTMRPGTEMPAGAGDSNGNRGSKQSRREGRDRNFEASTYEKNERNEHSKPRSAKMVQGTEFGPRPTSRTLTLEERFRVATIDDVLDQHFGKHDPDAPVGSWVDPLSVGELPPSRGKTSSMFMDENLALLSELESGILSEDYETLWQPTPLEGDPAVEDSLLPQLNFKDYAPEDALPLLHEQAVLSSDPSNAHDALHMRHVGRLCGVFQSPVFNGELRALNESAFLLRNLYINSWIRYNELHVIFKGPDNVLRLRLRIKDADKLSIHRKQFVLETHKTLAKLDNVTIQDNLKQFSVSVNISSCQRPSSLWLSKLEKTIHGVSSGPLVLHTANLMVVKAFTNPATCSPAYFWAGTGNNPGNGFLIPTLNGSSFSRKPLRVYQKEDVVLKLPNLTTFYDLDYVGVFCTALDQMLGYHFFRSSLRSDVILPPAFTSDDRIMNPRIRV